MKLLCGCAATPAHSQRLCRRLTALYTARLTHRTPPSCHEVLALRKLIVLTSVAALALTVTLCAQSSARISLQERVTKASQIYHIVSTFFPGLSQEKFETAYQQYLATALRSEDRLEFDLASMEFVAGLHDGHSWFYDRWFDHTYGQPVGFLAYPLGGKWTVVQSRLEQVRPGDVALTIDGVPTLVGIAPDVPVDMTPGGLEDRTRPSLAEGS